MLISKELLSEVLGYKIWKILDCNMGTLRYCIYPNKGDEPSEYMFPINIYELAHKCKEWAIENGFCVMSATFNADEDDIEENWIKDVNYAWAELHNEDKLFRADTEPEAIFKACQWILENKDDNVS